ncbi:MAG: hypothetical protein RI885_1207 [Actinomycetota bacterium]
MITRLLAQLAVSDLAGAESWYGRLFGREPDARPMDGLLEWHLTGSFGVQVWADGDRVGQATIVLHESDLSGRVAALDAAGIEHDDVTDATSAWILPLADPDGNRIVFTGSLSAGPGAPSPSGP